jgi:penicillin-binding protein 1A
MAGGLMNSVNTITAEVMMETGPEDVVALARGMGVRSRLPAVPSLALGTADVSLLEMVTAYTGFANGGVPVEPFGILRIEDSKGHILYEAGEAEQLPPAFSEETGILMSQMLQGVVDSGTAASARSIYGVRSRLAGKTGTTQNNADGWFIGYTPAFVAGVWVGAELPAVHFRTTALGSGSHMALPIFAMTAHAMENDPGLRTKYLLPFPAIPDTLAAMLDCPAFSRELPLEYLSRQEKREFRRELREKETLEKDSSKEKKGFFRKVRDFFRRKDK